MQLYFIRHGQSVNNAGWGNPDHKEHPDPALTEIGIQQAQILADFLAPSRTTSNGKNLDQTGESNPQNRLNEDGFTHLYASLMERAVHTASLLAPRLEIPFEAWEIHESGGIFEREGKDKLQGLPGRPRSFFETNFPAISLPESVDENGWWRERPFETEEECQQRAGRIWSDLLNRHNSDIGQTEHRVALVSHGGFFMHLMCAILELPWKNASHGLRSWFLLNNCSLSRIDVRDGYVTICYLNRTDHLPADMIT
jgi:broad specificity phosphatase PhoE